jgi:replicative superfamily II helicase
VVEELSAIDNSDLENLRSQMEDIESLYDISLSSEMNKLKQKEEEYEEYMDSQLESYLEDKTKGYEQPETLSEGKQIEEIFNSLVSG